MKRRALRSLWLGSFTLCLLWVVACATNPVTGKKQLALISEAQEIEMGREADKEVVASIGLYPDESMQRYIQALGARIAATTERPALPWTFRVVDDAAVNAFAIPGGFIYVTRGIMTHLNSEAELAAILGHEIGHVTARHSVSQMSKQQLAQVGLAAGMIVSPKFAQFGNLASAAMGLMFMKFSRSDESQSDALGLKYMMATGYDPRSLPNVFGMLEALSQQSAAGRLPQWMSTHPDPENRRVWATNAVAGLQRDLSGLAVNRPDYMRRLDGVMFGENPREGFFQEASFRHPDMAFRMGFPQGWKSSNEKQSVGAISPNEDAIVVLQLAPAPNGQQAAQKFFSQEGVESVESSRRQIGGFPAVVSTFRVQTEQGYLRGLVAWIDYRERVFQILGYTPEARWNQYSNVFSASIASFSRETDPDVLNVQPRRLTIIDLNRTATLETLLRDYPSTVPPQTVGLINNLQSAAATLAAGDQFKRVVGGQGR
jgi:predicted Zn-dependent protease